MPLFLTQRQPRREDAVFWHSYVVDNMSNIKATLPPHWRVAVKRSHFANNRHHVRQYTDPWGTMPLGSIIACDAASKLGGMIHPTLYTMLTNSNEQMMCWSFMFQTAGDAAVFRGLCAIEGAEVEPEL